MARRNYDMLVIGSGPAGHHAAIQSAKLGKTEAQLTEAGIPCEIGMARYNEIARGLIIGDDTGFLKLLFHANTRELLGVHILGEGASELVHIGQMVMAHGGKIDTLVNNVFNYPTLAECYKVAALAGVNKLNGR